MILGLIQGLCPNTQVCVLTDLTPSLSDPWSVSSQTVIQHTVVKTKM
jgi:hypothetical protein